jgi:hypothetical protein
VAAEEASEEEEVEVMLEAVVEAVGVVDFNEMKALQPKSLVSSRCVAIVTSRVECSIGEIRVDYRFLTRIPSPVLFC